MGLPERKPGFAHQPIGQVGCRGVAACDCSSQALAINPHIAQTVVHMGVDINSIVMHRTLRDALVKFVGDSIV